MTNSSEQIPASRLSAPKRALLEKRLRGAGAKEAAVIPRCITPGPAVLSPVQHGLWVLNQLLPNNAVYGINRTFRLRGPLHIAELRRALDKLTQRHESLRTSFPAHRPE